MESQIDTYAFPPSITMTRNCPHSSCPSNSAVSSSMASSEPCKSTDDEPFILVPTGEELLAQTFMKTAIQLGLLTVFLVFLNLYLGVAIDYIVWPIAVGLGGSAIVSVVATLRAEDAEKTAKSLREEAEEKEKKAKREKMELQCGLKDKESRLEQEKMLLNEKADRLDKKEKDLEHREKTLEDEIERRTKAEVEKRVFHGGSGV